MANACTALTSRMVSLVRLSDSPNGTFFNASTGVEIFSNSSGSHHELRKLDTRVNLITQATKLVSLSITLEASFLTLL